MAPPKGVPKHLSQTGVQRVSRRQKAFKPLSDGERAARYRATLSNEQKQMGNAVRVARQQSTLPPLLSKAMMNRFRKAQCALKVGAHYCYMPRALVTKPRKLPRGELVSVRGNWVVLKRLTHEAMSFKHRSPYVAVLVSEIIEVHG